MDLLRGYPPALAWFQSLAGSVAVSGLVVMELLQGCRDSSDLRAIEKLIRPLTVTWPDADDCDRALSTFKQHRLKNSIGILDALIGESAVGSNATLCTHNSRHFALITGLTLEHPYEKKP